MTGSGASTFFTRACATAACAFGIALGTSACSGATDSGLFDPGGSTGGGNEGAGDAGHGVLDGSGFDASTSPPDRDAHVDPVPPADSAPPVEDDAAAHDASFPDAAPSAEPPSVRCGNTTCDPATNVCCRIPGGTTDVFACLSAIACGAVVGALAIPCDDAVDCAGSSPTNGTPGAGNEVCCATLNAQTGRAESIACMPAQSCTSTLQTNLCGPNAPDACPNGGTCKISQTTIPGYDICF